MGGRGGLPREVGAPEAKCHSRSGVLISAPVFRAVLVAAILCLSFELSGLAALCGDPGCTDECPSERWGGQCPPNCQACGCCSLPKLVAPALPGSEVIRPATRSIAWSWTSELPLSPDPADILHVPRLLRA